MVQFQLSSKPCYSRLQSSWRVHLSFIMKVLILLALVAAAVATPPWSNSNKFDFASKWSCPLPRVGMTPECPAQSCKSIKELNPFSNDGKYWFILDGVVFPAWCDMTNGGFMMVVKFPKCFVPETRIPSSYNDMVSKPQTIWEVLETIVDVNEGKLDRFLKCDHISTIYKNRAWRHFEDLDIKRVRINIIKDCKVVKFLDFDAVGADRWSWFSLDRLIKKDLWSAWTDIEARELDTPAFWWKKNSTPWREWSMVTELKDNTPLTCSAKTGWFWGINNIHKFSTMTKCVDEYDTTCRGVHFFFSKLNLRARFNVKAEFELADSVTLSWW